MNETLSSGEEEMLANPSNNFFTDFGVAYHYVDSAVTSHNTQWKLVEAIEEHLEGKKPMDQKRLDELGMSWSFNYNYYRARGKIESAVSEFVDKMSRSLSLGFPEFRNSSEEDMNDETLSFLTDYHTRGIVASAIGCAFSEMMEAEGDIHSWLNKTEYLSYTFGYCGISWPSYDWKGDPIHIKNLACRPGSEIEDNEEWVIFKTEKANWLWKQYNRVKEAKVKSGWKIEAMELVLAKLFRGKVEKDGRDHSPETWAELLPSYNANPSCVMADTSDINLAKIYYLEADGRISETYIPWGYDWARASNEGSISSRADNVPMILFQKFHKKAPKEMLGFIRDSGFTTTGELAKMRGSGRMVVEDGQRYNRLRNSTHNKSLFSGSPWFEASNTQSHEKFKVTFSQGFVMMPAGASMVDRQPSFNISEHIGLLQYEEREFSSNSQHFNPSVTSQLSSRPTSDEIRVAQQETGRARSAKDTVKVSDYSKIFLQFIKKMARKPNSNHPNYEGHRYFFDLMIRYLPDYVKNDEDVIKILKAVNSYSISLILGDTQSIQLAITMSETPFGRNRYRRMLLIALGHARKEVDILVPLYQDKYRHMQDDRIAAIENDMFWNTNEVVFQKTDDSIIHFDSHNAKLQRTFQAVRDGRLDIVAVWKYSLNMMAHMDLHVQALLEDTTLRDKAKEYIEVMKANKKIVDQIAYSAQKEMDRRAEEAELQSAISPKDQAEINRQDAITKANVSRQDFKAAERVRQQDEKQQHDQQLAEKKLQADMQLKQREQSSNQQL